MSYKVGQVLYVVMSEKTAVVPVQIVEENHKKTLRGTEVTYVVRYGKEGKTVNIKDIDGEIFTNSTTVKRALIERSTQALNRLVNNAVERANTWYEGGFEGESGDNGLDDIVRKDGQPRDEKGRFVPAPVPDPEPTGDGRHTVELPDGTVARVKLPESMG